MCFGNRVELSLDVGMNPKEAGGEFGKQRNAGFYWREGSKEFPKRPARSSLRARLAVLNTSLSMATTAFLRLQV